MGILSDKLRRQIEWPLVLSCLNASLPGHFECVSAAMHEVRQQ